MDPFFSGVGFGDVDIRDVWGRPKQWRNAEAAALHYLCVGEVGVGGGWVLGCVRCEGCAARNACHVYRPIYRTSEAVVV